MYCWACNGKMMCKNSRPLNEGLEWKRKYVCPRCGAVAYTVETIVQKEGHSRMRQIENCVLGRNGCAANCSTDPSMKHCEGCGWDREVALERKELIRQKGLEEVSDARKAHIRKEWGMDVNRKIRGLRV